MFCVMSAIKRLEPQAIGFTPDEPNSNIEAYFVLSKVAKASYNSIGRPSGS